MSIPRSISSGWIAPVKRSPFVTLPIIVTFLISTCCKYARMEAIEPMLISR